MFTINKIGKNGAHSSGVQNCGYAGIEYYSSAYYFCSSSDTRILTPPEPLFRLISFHFLSPTRIDSDWFFYLMPEHNIRFQNL